jgi:hypothetical protein
MLRFSNSETRLYRFDLQGITWRFAQADRDVPHAGNTWLAAQIERDNIRQNSEQAQDKIKIRMAYLRDPAAPAGARPATQSLGDIWHPFIPSSSVRVTCYTLAADGTLTFDWSGEVRQPRFTDIELELTCVPGDVRGEAHNQGMKFQRACSKTVYSTGERGCNLPPAPLRIDTTLSAVAGLTVTSAAFTAAPHSLQQGWLYWTRANGVVERRTVIKHAGDTLTLLYGGHDLASGLAVSVLPNCQGTWAACASRRADPEMHYGGAIYEPVENPYDGASMSWG